MTPKQADKIIKAGKPVTVRTKYNETFTDTFISRDRWLIRSATGTYDRGDLELITTERKERS